MATLTAYPDPHIESTSVDGWVRRSVGTAESWATIIAGAGNSVSDENNPTDYCIRFLGGTSSNTWLNLYRTIFLFDTSTLTASATISAAVLSIASGNKADPSSNTPSVNIYTSTPAANTSLANSDYGQIGTTAQCDTAIGYASWAASGTYNDFTLNATGRGNVSKTGVSKFGVREVTYDVGASAPTWGSSVSTYMECYFADNTGTDKDPKLVVTYTLAAASTNFLLMF